MPYFEVVNDYTPLLTPRAEYLIEDSPIIIETFCSTNRGFKRSQPDLTVDKIIFTNNSNLILEVDTKHNVYLVYLGSKKKNWKINGLTKWNSPYTKEYIIRYIIGHYKLDYSTASYLYEITGGRYTTICNWLSLVKPGATRAELIDQFEPQGSCNMILLIQQLNNHETLLELSKLDLDLDAHRAFNYFCIAFAKKPVSILSNIIWNKSKETNTTKIEFIIFVNWLKYCLGKRRGLSDKQSCLKGLIPDFSELCLLQELLAE